MTLLKIMPGAEYDQLYRAMQLADRVSVNLEGPARELLRMLQLAEQIRRTHPYEKLAGAVTQFVVGAVGDTDHELLSVSNRLYKQMGLTRAYYSGFSPVEQTLLENLPATDALREHRLYQASFLLRDYGLRVEDLPFLSGGNLLLERDPKRAWVEIHLRPAPVEIKTATREQLLRIPGIGPIGADAILHALRRGSLTELAHLRKLHIHAPEQAAP